MADRKFRLLVVEDDPLVRRLFEQALLLDGRCETVAVGTCREAERQLRETTFDALVLDYDLPDGIGWHLAQRCAAAVPVVLMSATIDLNGVFIEPALRSRAQMLHKPFAVMELFRLVDKLAASRTG